MCCLKLRMTEPRIRYQLVIETTGADPNGTYLSPFIWFVYAQATESTWKGGWRDDKLVATKQPTLIRRRQP